MRSVTESPTARASTGRSLAQPSGARSSTTRSEASPVDGAPVDGWTGFAERWWNVAPTVGPATPPLAVSDAYRMIAEASAPFRAGTRFHVLPDVRFGTAAGRIRAPGDLLPGAADPDPDSYRERVGAELAGQGWLLAVEQPLFGNFADWLRVRDSIDRLWRRVGFPVVPVGAELVFGTGMTRIDGLTRDSRHAVLAWVLRGRLEVRVDGAVRCRAGAGELAYWPAGLRYTETFADDCLALLLRVPSDSRLAVGAVHDTAVELAGDGPAADDVVPYLPVPPSEGPGPVPMADPLARAATAIAGLSAAADLTRTLRVRWAARVSAGALEPVPPPREPVQLSAGTRVRRVAEVVRIRAARSGWIWAVHGHAFAVRGAAWALLRRLPLGTPVRVADVCGSAGDSAPDPGGLALLTTLYRLRAIEVLAGPAGEKS
ncbi:hypothetical protein Pma05_30830 [Plantactinospora mayteni]|uniref:Uncharacterized protein n=1 Tax=Plantactinospora mayteni TaxID=566021 RepID=A0ABQ4EPE6_9ACTN|nr:hypothetical protein Pma05_30830 [Plantactinospora mayteni]